MENPPAAKPEELSSILGTDIVEDFQTLSSGTDAHTEIFKILF